MSARLEVRAVLGYMLVRSYLFCMSLAEPRTSERVPIVQDINAMVWFAYR